MPIRFGTYNIRNCRNRRLESALRGMSHANVDVGVFQDTKLTEEIYTRLLSGYRVVATPAPSQHQGGVTIFYQESPVFAVEVIRQFGANVMACHMVMGERRWYIVGCYLAPGDRTTIRYVEAAMADHLDCKDRGFPIEYRDIALVLARCRRRDDPIP